MADLRLDGTFQEEHFKRNISRGTFQEEHFNPHIDSIKEWFTNAPTWLRRS